MGYISPKIYRLKTYLFLFLISILHITLLAKDELAGTAYRVVLPFYQDKGEHPLVILRCDEAKPIGIRIEMKGVTLDWIGDDVKDIKGVIKTASAVYDKNTQKVTGNEKITYRSSAMDLDGVGFDIDQAKQLVHIRSKVKVVLKSRLKHERGMHHTTPKGNISLKKSSKKFIIERIEDKTKPKQKAIEVIDNTKTGGVLSVFGWSSFLWLILLVAGIVIIVKFVNRKHRSKYR